MQGLEFEAVDVDVWLQRLRQYNEQTPSAKALRLNPAVKLVDFYQNTYGHGVRKDVKADNSTNEVTFDTTLAERDSLQLRDTPDVLESGLMGKIVQHWLKTWPSA